MMIFFLIFLLFLLVPSPAVLAAPCSLCPDGSSTPVPSKLVTIPGYPEADCDTVENLVPIFISDDTSNSCKLTHQMSSICGCPRPADSCSLCPDGLPVENKNMLLPNFDELIGNSGMNCELLEAYLHPYPETDTFCSYSQRSAAETCGCRQVTFEGEDNQHTLESDNIFDHHEGVIFEVDPSSNMLGRKIYGGGSTSRVKRLRRLHRASAILGGIGALLVIYDNLRGRQKRMQSVYNQIVTVMACFDVVYSIATGIGSTAKPSETYLAGGTRVAQGTYATCKAQGWAQQWSGMISLFLNAALSTYFVLVIVYGCREFRLKQLRKWLISIPIIIGSILGFGAIPFIVPYIKGCSINAPVSTIFNSQAMIEKWGYSTSWAPFLGFIIVPGFLVLVYTTGCLVWVFLYVRKINKKTKRWRKNMNRQMSTTDFSEDPFTTNGVDKAIPGFKERGNRRSFVVRQKKSVLDKLQREVFVQSALYLFALYLSWFVYLFSAVQGEKYILSHYGFWVLVHIVIPMQGFFNCIVYFRPRLSMRLSASFSRLKGWIQQLRTRRLVVDAKEDAEYDRDHQNSIMHLEPAANLEQLSESESSDVEGEEKKQAAASSGSYDQQPSTVLDMGTANNSERLGGHNSRILDAPLSRSFTTSLKTYEASGSLRLDAEESAERGTFG